MNNFAIGTMPGVVQIVTPLMTLFGIANHIIPEKWKVSKKRSMMVLVPAILLLLILPTVLIIIFYMNSHKREDWVMAMSKSKFYRDLAYWVCHQKSKFYKSDFEKCTN